MFLEEDEGVPSVYRNLKIFCETDHWPLPCIHTGNRSLNLGSSLELNLAQFELRVAVLN